MKILSGLALLLMVGGSTLPPSEEEVWKCATEAYAVKSFAEARERGMPRESLEEIAGEKFEDDPDLPVVLKLIAYVYDRPKLTIIMLWDQYYRTCINDPRARNSASLAT